MGLHWRPGNPEYVCLMYDVAQLASASHPPESPMQSASMWSRMYQSGLTSIRRATRAYIRGKTMFKIHIAAYYCHGDLEDCAYQDCVVLQLGEYTLIKADSKGKPAWEYGGWGKYAPSLTTTCLDIGHDIADLLSSVPNYAMKCAIQYARLTGRAKLPVDTSKYINADDVNVYANVSITWSNE